MITLNTTYSLVAKMGEALATTQPDWTIFYGKKFSKREAGAVSTSFSSETALGTMNSNEDNQLDKFLVVNGDPKPGDRSYEDTIDRLRGLLGQTNRHGFRSCELNFEGAGAVIQEALSD